MLLWQKQGCDQFVTIVRRSCGRLATGVIYKTGDVWYIDVRSKGGRIRKRIGTSRKIADLALKDAEVRIAHDEFGFAGKNDIATVNFIDKSLEYSQAHHSPNTYKRYRAVIDHFKRFLSVRPEITLLSQVQAKEIDEYKIFRKGGSIPTATRWSLTMILQATHAREPGPTPLISS